MPSTNHVLLLGAGFSRNWGGWLASEVYDYLLGCSEIDRALLLRHSRGGFQAVLAELQDEAASSQRNSDRQLENFFVALRRMFTDMDRAWESRPDFEFQQNRQYQIIPFLTRFNSVFSLNQDLLLERYYIGGSNILLSQGPNRLWDGGAVAGVRLLRPPENPMLPLTLGMWAPDPNGFAVPARTQPLYKLHGSCNWQAPGSNDLLVMGGNKPSAINRQPILRWCHEQFGAALSTPNTRLLIIGYGFADDHINSAICQSVRAGAKLFVIDPLGLPVMDSNRSAQIRSPSELAQALWPSVVGVSTRSLGETFGGDIAEHAKVSRFFA